MFLKPSEICYTQDSISNTFGRRTTHRNKCIGETLDDLCDESCKVQSIPKITVVKHNGKWFTLDNRRLWVFRHLERLGKCTEIEVIEGVTKTYCKFTTKTAGTSVKVRRLPGGVWHLKPNADTAASEACKSSINDEKKEGDESCKITIVKKAEKVLNTCKELRHSQNKQKTVKTSKARVKVNKKYYYRTYVNVNQTRCLYYTNYRDPSADLSKILEFNHNDPLNSDNYESYSSSYATYTPLYTNMYTTLGYYSDSDSDYYQVPDPYSEPDDFDYDFDDRYHDDLFYETYFEIDDENDDDDEFDNPDCDQFDSYYKDYDRKSYYDKGMDPGFKKIRGSYIDRNKRYYKRERKHKYMDYPTDDCFHDKYDYADSEQAPW